MHDARDAASIVATMPGPVRIFIAKAQAAGMVPGTEWSKWRFAWEREPRECQVVLHGPMHVLAGPPEMARHRIPKRDCHWWLRCGIVGHLYREGDNVRAVIQWTQINNPTREQVNEARTDERFRAFMAATLAAAQG